MKLSYYERHTEAVKSRVRDHYRANRDEINARRRARYREAPEKAKERAGRYYVENREAALASMAQRYAENPEPKRERALQWARDNPERVQARELRRKTRETNAFVEDVFPLVVLERDDGVCGICKEDVDPFDFHVDHIIPLAKGGEHSYANVQAAHPVCNLRKGTKI